MDNSPQNSGTGPGPDELQGSLRRAVEHVRNQQVPQEAMHRVLERVHDLSPTTVRPKRRFEKVILAAACAAAAVVLALLVRANLPGDRDREQAAKDRSQSRLALHHSHQSVASDKDVQFDREGLRIYNGAARKGEGKTRERSAPDTTELPARPGERLKDRRRVLSGYMDEKQHVPGQGASDDRPNGGLGGGLGGSQPRAGMMMGMMGMQMMGGAPAGMMGMGGGNQPPAGMMGMMGAGGRPPAGMMGMRGGMMGGQMMDGYYKTARGVMKPATSRVHTSVASGPESGEGRGAGPGKQHAEADKGPPTWHRASRRPTFARVYIGGGNSLELISLQVTVTVEGPRARTVVDHIFHNPHVRQLEGTFEYPLPAGASPSYFAMFLGQSRTTVPARFARRGDTPPLPQEALARLTPAELVKQVSASDWGTLHEAHVVSRARALEVYEEVVRGSIDPALLEYASGNTFSGRVFPIPAKGYNRVVIAYEELLPCTQGRVVYRYPLPDCKLNELQFTLHANAAERKDAPFSAKGVTKQEGAGVLSYSHTWNDKGPGGEARFAFTPPRPQVQVISGRQSESGPLYVYARIRPDLKVEDARPFADRAVFLLDTSLSEHPDGFARNMKLLRKILETDPAIKQFNILAFNVGTSWVEPHGWLPNTRASRDKAFSRLDGIVLEGATDLSAALDRLARPEFEIPEGTPLDVFLLSDGQITWGESDVGPLVARFESRCPYRTRFHCYRTGLGADNLELFEALTRKGGGIFNCFTDDVTAAAGAHRKQCFQVERVSLVGGGASDVLVAGRKAAIYPDGEMIVAARVNGKGPVTAVLEGTFLGKKLVQEYPLEIGGTGELAPRGWAEIAVASLLALNDSSLDSLVTAYCQQFGIGSRVASFLVLENDNDYKRFNLEQERGKTVKDGDLGRFLHDSWRSLGKVVSDREAFERFLAGIEPRVGLLAGANGEHVKTLLGLLKEKDFELPETDRGPALVYRKEVAADYLKARDTDLGDVHAYIAEAKRRAGAGDATGAVRVLSSVIEEYPARGDALRLVGYRLLDLKQPAQAVRLFRQVQRQRPFEPHSYLDLARSLEECGKFGLAAVQYETVLAGTWDARFHDSLKVVAGEDYVRMMRQAIRRSAVGRQLADRFGSRLERMASTRTQSDLRVSISWNTDNTDVDLWVIEPDGTKCFFQNTHTPSGGELSQDETQGYGPERYQIKKARPGVYTVMVHYFRANPNLLAGETHVNVVITRHADTPRETVERHTVILKENDEAVEVCKVKF